MIGISSPPSSPGLPIQTFHRALSRSTYRTSDLAGSELSGAHFMDIDPVKERRLSESGTQRPSAHSQRPRISVVRGAHGG